MCINERLKEIRKALNLNQSDMAEKLGMKQGSYSGIESGKKGTITKKTEKMLEYLFDVNIDYLLNGKGEMFNNENKNTHKTGNIGRDNIIINKSGGYSDTNVVGNIYGNIESSNQHISIILPEKGYQKIINSTGKETTLKMSDDEMPVVESLSAENRFLKQRITDLEKIIETKDDIINMYKGLIKHS